MNTYHRQVQLLVKLLVLVDSESCFALKGGTAINLFVQKLPRLSVDIDLVYLPSENRNTALGHIKQALDRISQLVEKQFKQARVVKSYLDKVDEKNFIISFQQNKPNWSLLGLDNIESLSAVKWKQLNIAKMPKQKLINETTKLKEILKL